MARKKTKRNKRYKKTKRKTRGGNSNSSSVYYTPPKSIKRTRKQVRAEKERLDAERERLIKKLPKHKRIEYQLKWIEELLIEQNRRNSRKTRKK